MDVYLPIAEVTQNVLVLIGLGLVVGLLTGMFGVGGGFLLTPTLMLIGIPAPVAVASSANQLVGASVAGVINHSRRGNVDYQMGGVLIAGGFFGSLAGVELFGWLRRLGQIDLTISLGFVVLLGTLGTMMLIESVGAILRDSAPGARRRLHQHAWFHRLPFKLRFRRSKLYISALLPLTLGFTVGVLSATLGIGGGFIVLPAMIYILGMPASVVPGTSLFQAIFIAAMTTIFQAVANHTVDGLLAILTLIGGLVGVHCGGLLAARIRGDYLRVLLALIVLAVGTKLLFDLTAEPPSRFSIAPREL
ncbi:MAG TPA: sulfite exporter TauE/SafE family protein [Stellaceae bacterium]|nr:sulfite exporter TauE/SafE family protein [Stellaceae bacterium]